MDNAAIAVAQAGSPRDFRTTHWSVVLAAGNSASPHAEAAIEKLCRTYWFPIYGFIRHQGHDRHEAQDLTQEFFCRFLQSQALGSVDPSRGRFRSFLIASLKHFLANEWDKAKRLKRGGGREFFSWDGLEPEERYRLEPSDEKSPETIFDQQWAQALVSATLAKLRVECADEDTESRFEVLKAFLSGNPEGISYAHAAEQLGLSESAVRSAIHRLRQRYAQIFRAQVAETVTSPEAAEAEIRHLFAALTA
jgi:RNA polymerase sigma-70 factor (ECF subfamily)